MYKFEKHLVSVSGNTFEYSLIGTLSPAIILINGAGGPLEGWSKICEMLKCDQVQFAYNRLGIGNSTKPMDPQTGNAMLKDLKEILSKLNIKPPYIIVGHSLGGFIAQLFAFTYPEDVLGLIFIESSTMKDVLSDKKNKNEIKPNDFSEVNHVLTTVNQIQKKKIDLDLPITVIAGSKPAFGWIMPQAIKDARMNNQKELLNITTKGKFTIASKSGHFPQLTEPSIIVNEIKEMLDVLYETNHPRVDD